MILPYVNPTFLPGSDDKTRIRLSQAVLENARDILAALERRHLETFTTALTLERLAEALYRPRLPDRAATCAMICQSPPPITWRTI